MQTLEKRLFGTKSPIVYEIFENQMFFEDFKGYRVVKLKYSEEQKARIINNVLMSAVDAIYTDVKDDVFIKSILEMGLIVYSLYPREGFSEVTRFGRKLYTAGGFRHGYVSEFCKSVLDKLGGFVGCLINLGLFIILAPIIKLDSKGPVLFKQERIGLNGRRFMCYKFRTMYQDAELKKEDLQSDSNEMSDHMYKVVDDPRITKVGNFLRKTGLDEFPQFFNVLKGEMSIVGTRPPTADELKTYEPKHKKRLCVKPGVTGVWQTSGRNKVTDFDDVIALDMSYIEHGNIFIYIKIVFKTVGAIFRQEGE